MNRIADRWCVLVLFMGTVTYAAAQDAASSQRGSYNELQTMDNTFLATAGGNVGIGTRTPAARLHLAGWGSRIYIDHPGTGSPTLEFRQGDGAEAIPSGRYEGAIWFQGWDGTAYRQSAYVSAVTEGIPGNGEVPAGIVFGTTSSSPTETKERLRITKDGNIGIGMTTPSFPLHMASGAYVTAGGVWTNASSREHKEDVSPLPLDKALETLRALNPVTFRSKVVGDERHVGFIAEEVPDLVAVKDRKGVSPMDIVAVLTKLVQHQQKEIEELKARLIKLDVANKK